MAARLVLKRILVAAVIAVAAGCSLFYLLVAGALIVGMPSKGEPVWRPVAKAVVSAYNENSHISK
ncbi:hypothetical protein DIE18_03300 [Burkholderia sp. Bp9125]|nr:hypothetical protein DIE18_03300 [Burkholderia sp. Bp9125]